MNYLASDWFWIVGDDESRYWSSAAKSYVAALPEGRIASRIASERELWGVLAAQAPQSLPSDPAAQDVLKESSVDAVDMVLLRVAFNHENRIRALESKQPVTAAQFRTALKALL